MEVEFVYDGVAVNMFYHILVKQFQFGHVNPNFSLFSKIKPNDNL